MSSSTKTRQQTDYRLTLLGKAGRKILYELTIHKDGKNIWRITRFYDRAEATPYLYDVGAAALKTNLLTQAVRDFLQGGLAWNAHWPQFKEAKATYEALMAGNVRVVITDRRGIQVETPSPDTILTVVFEPFPNRKGKRTVLRRMRIDTVA